MQQNFLVNGLSNPQDGCGGLAVRTGLRGGVCVDVNDQVRAALQTLTDALGGTTAAAAIPTTTVTPTTPSS
jgi:hypothetical protein